LSIEKQDSTTIQKCSAEEASNMDFGFYGKGMDGYVQYMQAFDRIQEGEKTRREASGRLGAAADAFSEEDSDTDGSEESTCDELEDGGGGDFSDGGADDL
jgi:hypothetical protein